MKQRVAVVTACITRRAGGMFSSIKDLAKALFQNGVDVQVFGFEDEFTDIDAYEWSPIIPKLFTPLGPRPFGYSREIGRAILDADPDIVQRHGLWELISRDVLLWSRRTGKPFITSPHGMLDPWALSHSKLKKRAASAMYVRQHLEKAHCIRALNESELNSIRALGLTNPVAVIPNGVHIPALPHAKTRPSFLGSDDRKMVLFLGRIHPKKGLVETIDAWASMLLGNSRLGNRWQLTIAGWDDGDHLKEVKARVAAHAIEDHVHFPGPIYGKLKSDALAYASAFILASYSEGLPGAVLEAFAHGTTAFITPACNLPEAFQAAAAIEISTNPNEISRVLLERLEDPTLSVVGRNGQNLAINRYAWSRIGSEFCALQGWLSGSRTRPSFIDVV